MKPILSLRRFLIHVGGLLAIAATAQAQTVWTGAEDNDWHAADNWSNGVPTAGVRADILTLGDVVNLNSAATAGEISVVAAGSGQRPVLNIAADLTAGRIQVGRDMSGNIGDGYVEHTAGDITLSGSTFSIRVGDGAGGLGEYRMTGGTLDASGHFYVGEHTSATTGGGTFHLEGGEITASGGQFYVGERKSGTFNMSGGSLSLTEARLIVGRQAGGDGSFLMTGGAVNTPELEVGRNGGVGEFIIRNGELTVTGNQIFVGNAGGAEGLFVKYGAADVEFSSSEANWRISDFASASTATFRAVIDQTGFSPIAHAGDLNIRSNTITNDANLEVALDGGVMLSGTSGFDLITVAGNVGGNGWSTTPGQLWTQTTGSGGVSIALDSNYDRGTLNASTIGNTINLSEAFSVGYIDLTNMDLGNPLHLRLGIDANSISGSNFDDFILDLAAAGYSPFESIANSVDIMFDPALNGAGYFAWDLSPYTDNPTLAFESITVIPEPRAALLGGLGLLMLLRRRRA